MFRLLGAVLRAVVAVALLVGVVSLTIGTGIPAIDRNVAEVADETAEIVDDADESLDSADLPVLSGSASSDAAAAPAAGTHTEYEDTVARLVHERINERRAERGLSSLSYSEDLEAIARYHSEDMATRSYFAHTGPDGQSLTDRYDRFGYDCRVAVDPLRYATGGENIYKSVAGERRSADELAREAVQGWMNSTGHRENLLKPYWNREGIGVNVTRQNGRTSVYVTQNFC